MVCERPRMSMIEPPVTYIFAVFFIAGFIITIVGNTLSLLLLSKQQQKTRYNKLLMWLSGADFLVGLIVSPLTGYQLLSDSALNNCTLDTVRLFFAGFLIGSSVMVLAVLTFDRYILIAKYTIYKNKMTKRILWLLLVLAWLIPLLTACLRWVGDRIYIPALFFTFLGPFLVLTISYVLITKTVRDQEKSLKSHSSMPDNRLHSLCSNGSKSRKESSIKTTTNIMTSEKKRIKLAKIVIVLLLVYFCCIFPFFVWIALKATVDPIIYEHFYLFSMLASSYNSCFNPFIYFAKNPELRRGLRRLFRPKVTPNGPNGLKDLTAISKSC